MKERPIHFNPEMIKALKEGRKTQTRRPVEPQPVFEVDAHMVRYGKNFHNKRGKFFKPQNAWQFIAEVFPSDCPEFATCSTIVPQDFWRCPFGEPGDRLVPWEDLEVVLEITDIRVERVQEISEEDCFSEGLKLSCPGMSILWDMKSLWDSIYEKKGFGWDANPWVWVIEFRKVEV